jgi:hypothetical protein
VPVHEDGVAGHGDYADERVVEAVRPPFLPRPRIDRDEIVPPAATGVGNEEVAPPVRRGSPELIAGSDLPPRIAGACVEPAHRAGVGRDVHHVRARAWRPGRCARTIVTPASRTARPAHRKLSRRCGLGRAGPRRGGCPRGRSGWRLRRSGRRARGRGFRRAGSSRRPGRGGSGGGGHSQGCPTCGPPRRGRRVAGTGKGRSAVAQGMGGIAEQDVGPADVVERVRLAEVVTDGLVEGEGLLGMVEGLVGATSLLPAAVARPAGR